MTTQAIRVKLVETMQRKGTYMVWVSRPGICTGYLRAGFAWKTKGGALRAAQKTFPGIAIEGV